MPSSTPTPEPPQVFDRARYYVPPTFTLLEMDTSMLDPDLGHPGRRWLLNINGQVSMPADGVSLGWRTGHEARVVVNTEMVRNGGWPLERQARSGAAFLVIGGMHFWGPEPPEQTGWRELLTQAEHDAESWQSGAVVVDGRATQAHARDILGIQVGHAVVDERLVTWAYVGIPSIRLQSLVDPSVYTADPLAPHSTDDLEREWDDFFRDIA